MRIYTLHFGKISYFKIGPTFARTPRNALVCIFYGIPLWNNTRWTIKYFNEFHFWARSKSASKHAREFVDFPQNEEPGFYLVAMFSSHFKTLKINHWMLSASFPCYISEFPEFHLIICLLKIGIMCHLLEASFSKSRLGVIFTLSKGLRELWLWKNFRHWEASASFVSACCATLIGTHALSPGLKTLTGAHTLSLGLKTTLLMRFDSWEMWKSIQSYVSNITRNG